MKKHYKQYKIKNSDNIKRKIKSKISSKKVIINKFKFKINQKHNKNLLINFIAKCIKSYYKIMI